MNESQARVALLELLYRNPIRHDRDAYDMVLALWGLGLVSQPPQPTDFSQETVELTEAESYALSQAGNYNDWQGERRKLTP
jgi:hypothetical protein